MPASINKVVLMGNVGKVPEIRSFQNGGKVANFSLATSEQWKDKQSGERKEATEWHNVQVFGEGSVGFVEKHVTKGTHLYIEGTLKTRKYTDAKGVEKYSTEIIVRPPHGGELKVLSWKDGKPGEEPVGEMPAELDDQIPY